MSNDKISNQEIGLPSSNESKFEETDNLHNLVASVDKEHNGPYLAQNSPKDDKRYPIKVIYCGNCTLPVEFCEYYPDNKKCKEWHEAHLADEMQVLLHGDDDIDNEGKKKSQRRGGKGMKVKKKSMPGQIFISRAPRGKRKYVTVIKGLASHNIDLKDATKYFGQKFACGASVTGEDEIVVQGDFKDDLWDILPEKWSSINEDMIEDLGDLKR